jgi:hypothetical protein
MTEIDDKIDVEELARATLNNSLGQPALARLRVLISLDEAITSCAGGRKGAARKNFVDDFNARKIAFEDASIYDVIGALSEPTLKRWRKAFCEGGADALQPRYGTRLRDGTIDRDGKLTEYISAQIAARPHISAALLIAGIRARFSDRKLPSYRALQRWVARHREEQKAALLAIANPDAYRSKFQVADG